MVSVSLKPRSIRGWTLRTRLLAAVIALMAAVCLVIGVVSVLAMRVFLEKRVDDGLTFAVKRSRLAAEQGGDLPGPAFRRLPGGSQPGSQSHLQPGARQPAFLLAPGQSQGTLGLIADGNGQVIRAGVLQSDGSAVALSAGQQAQIARTRPDAKPHTAELGGDLGPYRLLAQRTPGGDVLITGLPLAPARTAAWQLALVITGVSLAGLLLAALLGAVIVRSTLRPLRRVAATARQVAQIPLHRGEVALGVRVPDQDTDQRTEVGQVGAALNQMLGHVGAALSARQASEARVRQFVADASHELRTPLAAIRGYAELTRRGGQQVPPDVARAISRVESEAVRMTALVEDLLLLARLDEGRPMEHAPVDLTLVLVDAVSDAHAAGPDHQWQLDLPDQPVQIMGDAARLHQVVANLLANARVHTPPGTTVLVSLRSAGPAGPGTASPFASSAGFEIAVVDDGPGIAAELLPEVFERFARGDSSRSRAAGSTGLGLAIVSAVVQAHGGHVSVDSHSGRTAFIVWLPAAQQSGPENRPGGQDSGSVKINVGVS